MSEHELTKYVESYLNECFTRLKENKENYVRLEALIEIDLLFQMIITLHLEVTIHDKNFHRKVLSLTRTKRHYFKVILDPKDLKKKFTWNEKE